LDPCLKTADPQQHSIHIAKPAAETTTALKALVLSSSLQIMAWKMATSVTSALQSPASCSPHRWSRPLPKLSIFLCYCFTINFLLTPFKSSQGKLLQMLTDQSIYQVQFPRNRPRLVKISESKQRPQLWYVQTS
jgi:hypothetical protein